MSLFVKPKKALPEVVTALPAPPKLPPQTWRPQPKTTADGVDAEFNRLCVEEYENLAVRVGFSSPALLKQKLVLFLQSLGRGVYNYEEVRIFLNREFGVPREGWWKQTWGWRCLREKDAEHSGLRSWGRRENVPNGQMEMNGPYALQLPLEVLGLVNQIFTELPEAHFYVSDQPRGAEWASPREGDPFLAVTFDNLEELIVVACWDEPGFQGKMK